MIDIRKYAFLSIILCMASAAWAAPRSRQDMRRTVERLFVKIGQPLEVVSDIRLLDERAGMTIMGSRKAFAVVADDDVLPDILAYSETPFENALDNPHFCWWLKAMELSISQLSEAQIHRIKPDTEKYSEEVGPLLTTHWGQDHPYNMYCPKRYPTGCVTTATTQVMKYFEWPPCGQGTVFTLVPFGDYDGTRYEVTLGETEYAYDRMFNNYTGQIPRVQGEAVATLMYHVGLAVKSIYESSGTGSYSETLCHGLRTHMGYPYAVALSRDRYADEEWMDMIFSNLNAGIPIIYGGSDEDYSGHEFVLDGYDNEGLIHVNWGWDGSADGFFSMDALKINRFYDFTCYQDMVVGCSPNAISADTLEVEVSTPGSLPSLLSGQEDVRCLKVKGAINGSDLKVIRSLAGSDALGHGTFGQLSMLDLSEASIVSGGEPYIIVGGEALITDDGVMPYMAFAHCQRLIDVVLPEGLRSYAGAVFEGCNNLDRVVLHSGDESDFVVDDGDVLSADRQQLIEYLPDGSAETFYAIPEGVKVVREHAFSSRYLYDRLVIPESVSEIGRYAFNRCFNLTRTYCFADIPPAIDPSAIDDLDLSLRSLYVPRGSKTKYSQAPGWSKYKGRIVEFDKADGIVETAIPDYWDDVSPSAVYDINGRLVGWGAEILERLHPGVYVVNGKQTVVR